MLLVWYSTASGNTARFLRALDLPNLELQPGHEVIVDRPFVLVTPTYADGMGRGAVPKPVIKFLNNPGNRQHLLGVIAGGNRNFGEFFARAGDVIAQKCGVPVLYRFELAGTPADVARVKQGLEKLWALKQSNAA